MLLYTNMHFNLSENFHAWFVMENFSIAWLLFCLFFYLGKWFEFCQDLYQKAPGCVASQSIGDSMSASASLRNVACTHLYGRFRLHYVGLTHFLFHAHTPAFLLGPDILTEKEGILLRHKFFVGIWYNGKSTKKKFSIDIFPNNYQIKQSAASSLTELEKQ